ncbi:unnamed protein product [Caenorhabditis brenneri]
MSGQAQSTSVTNNKVDASTQTDSSYTATPSVSPCSSCSSLCSLDSPVRRRIQGYQPRHASMFVHALLATLRYSNDEANNEQE